MKTRLLIGLLIVIALSGCGGSTSVSGPQGPGVYPADGSPGALMLRDASGAPSGVRLTWAKLSTDIVGYHIYKSSSPIPDMARGDDQFWLSLGGDPLIPQPDAASTTVTVDDLFAAVVGVSWYYRLTAVDGAGEESRLSPEEQVDIVPFNIISLTTDTVAVGATFGINGEFFGTYDPAGDKVQVAGVEWQTGVGFVPIMLDAPVVSWTPALIEATLPVGATSGPVEVTSNSLTAPSAMPLTNSDPYITSLTPLTANMMEEVTIVGNNFGPSMNINRRVVFNDANLFKGYKSYTNTQIVFTPPNLHLYGAMPVLVRVNGKDSLTGFLDLTNSPPVCYFTVIPAQGSDPLDTLLRPAVEINSNWFYCYDPEGATIMEYRYDFESDGTDDIVDTVPVDQVHIFTPTGDYACKLTILDSDGLESSTTVNVHVGNEFVVLTDNGSPPAGRIHPDPAGLLIKYTLGSGVAPYTINWYLLDNATPPNATLLATETGLPAGNGEHSFIIDLSQALPVAGNNTVPSGQWQIRGESQDSAATNDPDMSYVWPDASSYYDVVGENIYVLRDTQGDPTSSESDAIVHDLAAARYVVKKLDNSGLTVDQFLAADAVVVAADGPHGAAGAPYNWLNTADLTLLTEIADQGKSIIILGPPSQTLASAPFTNYATFNTSYQPFSLCNVHNQAASLPPLDYTASFFDVFTDVSYNGDFGDAGAGALQNGGTAQMQWVTAVTAQVAGVCNGPTAGNVYVGMFCYSKITSVAPGTLSKVQLLNNIVSGTVNNRL